jgi:hypothetical protein
VTKAAAYGLCGDPVLTSVPSWGPGLQLLPISHRVKEQSQTTKGSGISQRKLEMEFSSVTGIDNAELIS